MCRGQGSCIMALHGSTILSSIFFIDFIFFDFGRDGVDLILWHNWDFYAEK